MRTKSQSETRHSFHTRYVGSRYLRSFIIHPATFTMSNTLTEIAASAQRITDMIGPRSGITTKLTLSGRSPTLPEVSLQYFVVATTYDCVDTATRERIEAVLGVELSSLRGRITRQYWQTVGQLYSHQLHGMPDAEIEDQLLGAYEARYQRFLLDIKKVLARTLARNDGPTDNRNTRGGFGDVSHPISLQANKFSKPSESSKQHSITQNPPSQPK
jgi:hypothetical protein